MIQEGNVWGIAVKQDHPHSLMHNQNKHWIVTAVSIIKMFIFCIGNSKWKIPSTWQICNSADRWYSEVKRMRGPWKFSWECSFTSLIWHQSLVLWGAPWGMSNHQQAHTKSVHSWNRGMKDKKDVNIQASRLALCELCSSVPFTLGAAMNWKELQYYPMSEPIFFLKLECASPIIMGSEIPDLSLWAANHVYSNKDKHNLQPDLNDNHLI